MITLTAGFLSPADYLELRRHREWHTRTAFRPANENLN
jgi:hypothetical protein